MRASRNDKDRDAWVDVSLADGGMRASRNVPAVSLLTTRSLADGGMRASRNDGTQLQFPAEV